MLPSLRDMTARECRGYTRFHAEALAPCAARTTAPNKHPRPLTNHTCEQIWGRRTPACCFHEAVTHAEEKSEGAPPTASSVGEQTVRRHRPKAVSKHDPHTTLTSPSYPRKQGQPALPTRQASSPGKFASSNPIAGKRFRD
jgi:hypothetical protein